MQPDPAQDVLPLALVERHHGTGRVVSGFVQGFDAACGVATTVAHDWHHLLVTGACAGNMAQAANTLVDAAGGVAVVREGAVTALVELPIGGPISDEPAGVVAGKSARVMRALGESGCAQQRLHAAQPAGAGRDPRAAHLRPGTGRRLPLHPHPRDSVALVPSLGHAALRWGDIESLSRSSPESSPCVPKGNSIIKEERTMMNNRKLKRLCSLLAFVFLAGSAGLADVGDLTTWLEGLGNDTERVLIGKLREGTEVTYTLRGFRDGYYIISGICDYDCDDIDLCVTSDGTGDDWEDCDNASDDFPIVDLWSDGTIRVELDMYSCDTSRGCYYGIIIERE